MSEQTGTVTIETAFVTDRGLNEKRPLNEDSYLLDAARGIFAVADGVGGAEAGEVASQTAVEVLDEAFRHHKAGDDVEDLMELAIQRANASIYQLAHEERRFAMMATTIVALHLAGRHATIGHVGDSRLYRLAPDGTLHRETDDHSVVEEEVRAGRMTAEQAAHHPSRNVISRALGAEQSVEVDLQTKEVEDGTIFLLCSDGITRHIPDTELSALLRDTDSLEAACAEMKRRCHERGAEDNLTAVVVRVGARAEGATPTPAADDLDRTIQTNHKQIAADAQAAASAAAVTATTPSLQRPFANKGMANSGTRVVVPAPQPDEQTAIHTSNPGHGPRPNSAVGRAGNWFGVLLLVVGAAALAFYGGMRYQRAHAVFGSDPTASTTPTPTPESPEARFERLRREVDAAPGAMAQRYADELSRQEPQTNEPEFLYLYGRALLLSGKQPEAMRVFAQALQRLNEQAAASRDPLRVEARIATAAAALKSNDRAAAERAARELDEVIEQQTRVNAPAGVASPTPP
ncbi:MAG: PP2C family protein-serine/threonine phosphatase [Pyrinomonadaceae bacterium]